jgi:hypothetical protein
MNPKEVPKAATAAATTNFSISATVSKVVKFRSLPLTDSVLDYATRKAHLEGRIEDFAIWLKTDGRSRLPSTSADTAKQFNGLPDPETHLRSIADAAFSLQEIQPGAHTVGMACTDLGKAVFGVVIEIEAERFKAVLAIKPHLSHYSDNMRAASEIYATGIADYFAIRLSEHFDVAVRAVA